MKILYFQKPVNKDRNRRALGNLDTNNSAANVQATAICKGIEVQAARGTENMGYEMMASKRPPKVEPENMDYLISIPELKEELPDECMEVEG